MLTETMSINEVALSWLEKGNKKYLRFLFNGDFTESEAYPAIENWDMEFAAVSLGSKVDLIWNCLEMKKYSAGAAKLWKNAMNKHNPKIETIWLVTSNTFIKMGARTVTFLLPINLKVVSTEAQVS